LESKSDPGRQTNKFCDSFPNYRRGVPIWRKLQFYDRRFKGNILERLKNQNASGVGDANQVVTFNQSGSYRIDFDINHVENIPIDKGLLGQASYYMMVGLYLTSNTFVSQVVRFSTVLGQTPLDVALQPIWSDGGNLYFKIGFYQKGGQNPFQGVQYNLILYNQSNTDDATKPIYDYANA
jgi:hypothetical protein